MNQTHSFTIHKLAMYDHLKHLEFEGIHICTNFNHKKKKNIAKNYWQSRLLNNKQI